MSSRPPQLLIDLLSPLSLAAYAAWAMVWIGSIRSLAQLEPLWRFSVQAALVLFLGGFVLCILGPGLQTTWRARIMGLLLAVLALFVIASVRNGAGPILLVLWAAMLAVQLPARELLIGLLLGNAALLAIMVGVWGYQGQNLWVSVLAYGSFQSFAALLMRTARRAEDTAERLRAANAELLTNRTLLAESARDQERLRLSRELHDVAGHGLTALKLNLGVLARDSAQSDPERIKLCAELADELLQSLRHVVQQMRHESDIDLPAALQRLGLPFPRPQLHLQIDPQLKINNRAQVEAVLRAVQEALTNAARHGQAKRLNVCLRSIDEQLQLLIEDDGRAPASLQAGGGLNGMRERFEQLGGSLAVEAGRDGGLRLLALWPREATA